MLKLRSRARADLSFVGLRRRVVRVGPGSPARRGKGTAGTRATPGGPLTPRFRGPAGWAHAGESLVLVRTGRDHGAGPVGRSWAGARRGIVGRRESNAPRASAAARVTGQRHGRENGCWGAASRRPGAAWLTPAPRIPPPVLGAPTSGLQLAPALPARGWEPRQLARAAGEAGPRAGSPPLPAGPLPQVPSRAPRAACAARSPPPARPGTPRRWARPAEDKVRRRRGDARVRLEGAWWRRTRLGSVPPDRGAGLGQPPVKRSRSSGGGGGTVFSRRISP